MGKSQIKSHCQISNLKSYFPSNLKSSNDKSEIESQIFTYRFKHDTFCSLIFTALHAMQTRSSDENSVRPSVCQSNAWIVAKQKKICPYFYTIRKYI